MSYYDVAVGGVRDNGTSYLQVGLNNKIQLSYLKKKKLKGEIIFYIPRHAYYVFCLISFIFPLKLRRYILIAKVFQINIKYVPDSCMEMWTQVY